MEFEMQKDYMISLRILCDKNYQFSDFFLNFRNGCKVSISSSMEPDLSVLMSNEKRERRPGYKISIGSMSTDITDVGLIYSHRIDNFCARKIYMNKVTVLLYA